MKLLVTQPARSLTQRSRSCRTERCGDDGPARWERGDARRVSFVLDRAGAFGYYGSGDRGYNQNPIETIETRAFRDAELSGAIVVE